MHTRNSKYDYIRVIAMFLVIGVHSWGSIRDINSTVLLDNALELLFQLGVPFFFALSGALILREDCKDFLMFYRKRAIAIIVPMLVFAPLYVFYADYEVGSLSIATIGRYFQKVVCGQVHNTWWFVYSILGIYLVAPFIARMLSSLSDAQKKILFYVLYAYLTISVVLSLIGWEFGITGVLFSSGGWWSFILGYYGYYFGQQKFSTKKVATLSLIVVGILVIYLLGYDKMDFLRSTLILIVFMLASQPTNHCTDSPSNINKIVSALAQKSYGIYLMHAAVLSLLLKLYTTWEGLIYGKLLLLMLAVAMLSYIINTIADKIVIERVQRILRKKFITMKRTNAL